ncbi:MAG: DnaB-like helicase C-terminal domain-containing protein [Bacteroidota bacterium]|nr:DnaB-like helicase C-terminal domain-containing protein [Bacteroidota bacterium]
MIFINGRQEVEALLLSSLINSNGSFVKYKRNILTEYFSNELHKKIFEAMLLINSEGGRFDLISIKTVGNLSNQDVCGLAEISSLECSSRNLGLFVRKLTELVIKEKINNFKLKKTEDVFDEQSEMQRINLEISQLFNSHTRKPKDTMLNDFEKYLEVNQAGIKRIKTPFPTLTRMLSGGFSPGSFVLVGGVPGSGKTSLLLQIAISAAMQNYKIHFIESEMAESEIFERCCGILTETDIDKLRCGQEYAAAAIAQLQQLPIEFHFDYKRTLSNLINEVELAAVNGASLVIVDYLQVYGERSKTSSDEFLSIKKVSEQLRQIALKYNFVLIVASSLNRNEITSNKPGLNSLYGSSGLGHDCSQGILLYGEQQDEKEMIKSERSLTLRVVKNRTGVRGDIALKYFLDSQKMVELETRF